MLREFIDVVSVTFTLLISKLCLLKRIPPFFLKVVYSTFKQKKDRIRYAKTRKNITH